MCPIYDLYIANMPVRKETRVLGHWIGGVGWPVPFLADFISTVSSLDPHSLLSKHHSPRSSCFSNHGFSAQWMIALTLYYSFIAKESDLFSEELLR